MSFDYDRPDSLRPQDWEHETTTDDGATILISKVGGGTIGREYTGTWHYSYDRGNRHEEGSDLVTGSPHTHTDAAELVAVFLEDEHY